MRILVVEDEARTAALLKRGLTEVGYAVDVAATGPDGLWHAGEFPYGAVVLDHMLPGLTGVELCRRLRARGQLVPVVMLTARDSVTDRVTALDAGADDYVAKPFSFDELDARLRAVVRRGGARRESEIQVGDLRLDPAAHRAWRGSTELDLSAKEFALLRLFFDHVSQTLTRAQILDHVWGVDYQGMSNVVDQYVRYLRHKIDRPFGVEQLETVRGLGYRLCEQPSRLLENAGAHAI